MKYDFIDSHLIVHFYIDMFFIQLYLGVCLEIHRESGLIYMYSLFHI